MGGNLSKQTVDNKVLNKIMIEVMTKNSNTISGSIDQTNNMEIVGNTDKVVIHGVEQINSSKINVSALAQSTANNTLQADLISKLSSKVEQANPLIAVGSDTYQTISSAITNAINSNITTENMQNIAAQVKGLNTIKVIANAGVDVSAVIQKNESSLILELVNKTSSEIVTAVSAKTEVSTDATQKTASLFDFGAGGIIFIIIIVIIGGFLYYVKSSGLAIAEIVAKPQVIALIMFMIGLTTYGVYASSSKK